MIRLSAFSDEAAESLDGQIEALLRNGISYTDIRSVDGVNVLDFTLEEAREYNERLRAAGISVYSIGSPIGKVDIKCDFDKYLEKAEHIFELARIFGTKRIRMFSFFEAYEKEELVVEYLRRLVALADEWGVALYHENEKMIFGDTVERTERLLDSVRGLHSIYDPANFVEVGENMDYAMERLFERTEHFHIKDVIAETSELVPAGVGDGKIREIIERIPPQSDMVLTLEPHLAIFAGYAAIDSTEMKNKFNFESNGEAFDAAVAALKKILAEANYIEKDGGFIKK